MAATGTAAAAGPPLLVLLLVVISILGISTESENFNVTGHCSLLPWLRQPWYVHSSYSDTIITYTRCVSYLIHT
jgi:hypothetical protein